MADGVFSFDASNPGSYNEMEQRRRIALQMMAQGKKGYPKNVGEGLSSIGDSVTEGLMMRSLTQQAAALQQARLADEAKAAAVAGNPPAAAVPGKRADVVDEGVVPPVTTAAVEEPLPPPAQVVPPVASRTVAPPPMQVASAAPPPTNAPILQNPDGSIRGNLTAPTPFPPYTEPPPQAPPPMPMPRPAGANAMPGTPEQGQRLAGSFDALAQPPFSAADATAESRLSDVTGMGGGNSAGFSYPRTASLGRTGDVMSDTPNTTGISPTVGAAAADTVMQRRDDIARTLNQQPTAPVVPQGNPTPAAGSIPPISLGSPPEAAGNRPIVSEVAPMPVAPGTQTAQAMPPGLKPPTAQPEPVPPPDRVPRREIQTDVPRAPRIEDVPRTPQQLELERMHRRAVIGGDPATQATIQSHIKPFEDARQSEYARRLKEYEKDLEFRNTKRAAEEAFDRDKSERTLRIQKAEDEAQQRGYDEKIKRALGGVPQEVYIKGIDKSAENIKNLPSSVQSINGVRKLLATDKTMFTGADAEIQLSLAKMVKALGWPEDPRIAKTEQFKSMIAPVVAQARQALVGGANISNTDLSAAADAAAGKITLSRDAILRTMDALERINLQTALHHQRQVARFAGAFDPDRSAAVYDAMGVPGMEQIVPQGAVDRLKKFANDPNEHKLFDEAYHTPGLSRRVLLGR
jgi:hypothetical protein